MKQKLLIKVIVLFTIFLLTGLGLNPVVCSNKIIEQKQSNDIILNPQLSEIDDTNTFSFNEKELELLKNCISNKLLTYITIERIIKSIKNMVDTNPSLLRKNLIISQGWSYNTNLFKNTKFQIKSEIFSFWHYAQASQHGIESKTFVIGSNDVTSSRTIELYRGIQTGFMIRPIGLFFFQKNTFPSMSYTLFIGFASNVFITAEEIVEIPIPLT